MKTNTAGRILKYIFILSIPIALIFPRSKKIWIFGNKKGYIDNTKYFFEYSHSRGDNRCIWLSHDIKTRDKLRYLGFESHLLKSPQGIWLSLRGGFQFIGNGFGDINRELSLGSKVINFWHGTPIKKIYLDVKEDNRRLGGGFFSNRIGWISLYFLNKFIYRYYASNSLEREIVTKAARISRKKSRVLGSPRLDYIRSNELMSKEAINLLEGRRIILFAPTWRDRGIWSDAHKISKSELIDLESILELENYLLIIKPHPFTTEEEQLSWGFTKSSRIQSASNLGIEDINTLYAHTDILITDVSSSIFDFLATDGRVILFMPDYRDYTNTRGLYDYYKETLTTNCKTNWHEIISELQKIHSREKAEEPNFIKAIRHEITQTTNACQNIYNDITS